MALSNEKMPQSNTGAGQNVATLERTGLCSSRPTGVAVSLSSRPTGVVNNMNQSEDEKGYGRIVRTIQARPKR